MSSLWTNSIGYVVHETLCGGTYLVVLCHCKKNTTQECAYSLFVGSSSSLPSPEELEKKLINFLTEKEINTLSLLDGVAIVVKELGLDLSRDERKIFDWHMANLEYGCAQVPYLPRFNVCAVRHCKFNFHSLQTNNIGQYALDVGRSECI